VATHKAKDTTPRACRWETNTWVSATYTGSPIGARRCARIWRDPSRCRENPESRRADTASKPERCRAPRQGRRDPDVPRRAGPMSARSFREGEGWYVVGAGSRPVGRSEHRALRGHHRGCGLLQLRDLNVPSVNNKEEGAYSRAPTDRRRSGRPTTQDPGVESGVRALPVAAPRYQGSASATLARYLVRALPPAGLRAGSG